MGMHHGLIVADTSAARLLEALSRQTGEFVVAGEAGRIEELDLDNDDLGFALAIGESGGGAYVYDGSLTLSGAPDLLAAVSGDLGGAVAGAGAETTSGSYWFAAARNGELLRFHWNSYWGQDAPYDIGEPLPSEELDPLEDLDGVGLRAALDGLGFDADAHLSIPLVPYRWTYDRPPVSGPHADGLRSFHETHGYPDNDKPPKPAVIRRAGGAFDVAPPESRLPRGEIGHVPRPQGRPPESDRIGQRLGRLFGRN